MQKYKNTFKIKYLLLIICSFRLYNIISTKRMYKSDDK